MKIMKKISALVIAMVMVLAMALPAMAEDTPTTPATTTVKHTVSTSSTTHSYEIYQIYTGKYDATSKQLQEIKYGTNAVLPTGASVGDAVSQADAAELDRIAKATYADDQAKIADLEKLVNMTNPVATLKATKEGNVVTPATASLEEGYYVIKDKDGSLADPETYTLFLFNVLNEDTEISPKSGTVEKEKHVDDQNDSDATDHSELKDSADYDIGDSIPYTLTAKLPADYANYKEYYLQFSDDMSKGLAYNGDAMIYYGADTTGASIDFEAVSGSEYTGGQLYTYTIEDLKKVATLSAGDVITIKYTATLDSDAVIGEAGNPNKYKITYSNNPNNTGDGNTNTTPWDVNIVFTYKTVFNKVDPDGKALSGADFKLEKKVVDETAEGGFRWVDVTALNTGDGAKNPTKTASDKDGVTGAVFTFAGLDAGDYKLTETKVPTGYNGIDQIEFTITATHDLVSEDPKLTALTGTDGAEFTMTPSIPDGSLTADIENNSGATLPSTGGIGTTIFYVIGGILVVLAGIVLVSKRKSAE